MTQNRAIASGALAIRSFSCSLLLLLILFLFLLFIFLIILPIFPRSMKSKRRMKIRKRRYE